MPPFDYLIIGQGIAGTSLAWHLYWHNQRFLIIDNPSLPSSSKAAGGIFNPLTGRKLVKTWLADELFPYAADYYGRVQALLGGDFFHPLEMYRPFRNEKEKELYLSIVKDDSYRTYVSTAPTSFPTNPFIHAPLDGLTVLQSGWIEVPHYLTLSRNYFQESGCYQSAHFSGSDLEILPDRVRWKELEFKAVINCMGVSAEKDPLFNWLPFNPVKGQLIDCKIDGYDIGPIVNQGIFLLPLANGLVRVGATYSWHDLDWETTEDGRAYLSEKLGKLLKVPFQVVHQQAGIRPSSKDRRPFAGRHPEYNRLYILNGLGTKGVTLAPFFARQLVNLMLFGEELYPDVNIERYFSLYSNPR